MGINSDSSAKNSSGTWSNISALSYKLKKTANDIIDCAYRSENNSNYKRFEIITTNNEKKTFLGDCRYNPETKKSTIRIVNLNIVSWQSAIITLLHEVSHHIDYINRQFSDHSEAFYSIHKKLLFTAFDMGIISKYDVLNDAQTGSAANRNKLARMMEDYIPHPVAYKQNIISLYIYNIYSQKDFLKGRGYSWNPLDKAWTKELDCSEEKTEREYLIQTLSIPDKDIISKSGGSIATRLTKTIFFYNVPYESRETMKQYGYKWSSEKKVWIKTIVESIDTSEQKNILSLSENIKIKIK